MTTDHPPQVEELLPCPICGDYPRRNGRGRAGGVVCASTGLLSKRPSHRIQTYGATQADADAAWNTRLSSTPQPSGEGLVLVPREPTKAMVRAGMDSGQWDDTDLIASQVRECWSAMLSAEPGSSQPSDMIGRERELLLDLEDAARVYASHFMIDEAEDDDGSVCSEDQHLAAKRVCDAIAALDEHALSTTDGGKKL